MFNVGNFLWIFFVYVQRLPTGDGTLADLMFALAGVLSLAAAMVVVVRRGRRDIGGVLDAAVTALALGGLLWTVLLMPHLSATGTPMNRIVPLFIDVFVMIGALGAMLRVAMVASQRIVATWLLAAGLLFSLVSNVVVALFTDPVTHLRPDWTNLPFLIAYCALGCAALHPSAAVITRPDAAPDDDLSAGRLTFLGFMTAAIPLLVAAGSAMVIPLVMVRIARLSAQRKRAERQLHRLATRDSLTGLPNRAAALDRLDAEISRPGAALLFCDLDGFKPVNDRLGHAAGDELLIAVADRLRTSVRGEDLVSRFGGDEFVIVCRAGEVEALVERIRDVVAQPFTAGGEQVRIGLSVGVAHAAADTSTDELIGRADAAMYEAKQSKAVGRLSLVTA